MSLPMFVNSAPKQYPEDQAFYSKEIDPETLCDKIKKFLNECGIVYTFNSLDIEFELHFTGKHTTFKLQIFRNVGSEDSAENHFVIVPTIYGNDRSLEDYRIIRAIAAIIVQESITEADMEIVRRMASLTTDYL